MKIRISGRFLLYLLMLALAAGAPSILIVSAVATEESSSKSETINNAGIIELQGLNFGDSVIIEKIKTSKCNFDLTIDGLKQLKAAKVSDAVIQAMLAAKPGASPSSTSPAIEAKESLPVGDINDPLTRHDSGIWLYDETNGIKKMTQLASEPYSVQMGAGVFGSATRAHLTTFAAKIQTASSRPVFYIYFGDENNDNFSSKAATTPDQMTLARMELKPKKQERNLIIGSVVIFNGVQSGVPVKFIVNKDSEKVALGVYKVVPSIDLIEGEYGFYLPTGEGLMSSTGGKIYGFGVSQKAKKTE
jgi:hypothetical protein